MGPGDETMLTSRATGEEAGDDASGGEEGGRGDFAREGEERRLWVGRDVFNGVLRLVDELACALLNGNDKN
jgi:hypothetical protein